jgi:hypothetical protein
VPLYATIEVINVIMNKKKGEDEKMNNKPIVMSREAYQNFKERSYEIPSYKIRYLRNKQKRERSKIRH